MRPTMHPYVEGVLQKCDALQRARFWTNHVRAVAWLKGFDEPDQPVAAVLLDRFAFFSAEHTDRLFAAAYRSLLESLTFDHQPDLPAAETQLSAFGSLAYFTLVEGEQPNPTDSGNLFCRKARQGLGIAEERIVKPDDAVERAALGHPIVFLDDFIGTGQQMHGTWTRPYRASSPKSFAEAKALSSFQAYYICVGATARGLSLVTSLGVRVFAAHVFGQEQSLLGSVHFPVVLGIPDTRSAVLTLLHKYGPTLDVVKPWMSLGRNAVFGFNDLGLCVGFEHSTPDASLPIFWGRRAPPWTPLVELA